MVESFLAINPSFKWQQLRAPRARVWVVGYGGLGKIQGFVVVLIVEFNHGVTNFFCDGG